LRPTSTQPVLPTSTPTVTRTNTVEPSATSRYSRCKVLSQNPTDYSTLPKNSDFDMRWTLQNSSDEDWDASNLDLRWLGGDKLHTRGDLLDFKGNLAPGDTTEVVIDMHTPLKTGSFYTAWALVEGSKVYCSFDLTIEVK
jgi:hypothetical protein